MRHRFCASSHSALDLSPISSHFQRLRADNKHVVYFNIWETPSLLQLRPQLSCLTRLAYYKTALSQHCLRAYKADSGSPRLDISLIFHTTNKVTDGYCLSFSLQALRLSKPSTAATHNFYFTRHDILLHLQRVPLRLLNEMLLRSAVSNLAQPRVLSFPWIASTVVCTTFGCILRGYCLTSKSSCRLLLLQLQILQL